MRTFILKGLPEGLIGCSSVKARSRHDLLRRYPVLASVRDKLLFDGTIVRGYEPCDG